MKKFNAYFNAFSLKLTFICFNFLFKICSPSKEIFFSSSFNEDFIIDLALEVLTKSIHLASGDIFSEVKVFSFEPESNNFQILNQNIILNNLNKSVTAYPIGISDKLEVTNLYLTNWAKGGSHNTVGVQLNHKLQKFQPRFTQGTMSITLDDLINKFMLPYPNYLKIDVDGIEHKIIKAGNKFLKDKRLESILIEINSSRKEDKEIIKILSKNGFQYNNQQVQESTRKSGPHKGYAEYLFFK